jgi:hypothetical protein
MIETEELALYIIKLHFGDVVEVGTFRYNNKQQHHDVGYDR